MKIIRSEKGYTGIDIAISVIVIFIFVSIISVLIYNFNSKTKEIELKSEATNIAINEIEKIKQQGFEDYDTLNQNSKEDEKGNSLENIATEKEGFYKTITVTDYTDIERNENKIPNLVKKVTVKISYVFKAEEQSVELSTILSKES